jgi:uncharacterized RDD family membrane protein YckC
MSVDETLAIETPEQVTLELPVAGIGSRFAALAIDTVIQIVLYVVSGVVLALGIPSVFSRAPAWLRTSGPALAILALYTLYWGYFSIFEIWWDGRTPGKRLASIRVIKSNGRPIRFYEALARNILRAIDFLPAMYAVGVVAMALDRKSRRLGDLVAGTIVVHDRRDSVTATAGLTFPDLPASEAVAAHKGARLTAEELTLIESYLQRRFDLDPIVRDRIAEQIIDRLATKTGIDTRSPRSNDALLESLARSARDHGRYR